MWRSRTTDASTHVGCSSSAEPDAYFSLLPDDALFAPSASASSFELPSLILFPPALFPLALFPLALFRFVVDALDSSASVEDPFEGDGISADNRAATVRNSGA